MLDGFAALDESSKELVQARVKQSLVEEDLDLKPIDPDELVRKEWTSPKEPSPDLLMYGFNSLWII